MFNILFFIQMILFLSFVIFYINIFWQLHIFLYIFFILYTLIPILIYKKKFFNKNIKFPSLDYTKHNFTNYVINTFILSIRQKSFIIVYSFYSELSKELNVKQLLYLFVSFLKFIGLIIFLDLLYNLLVHVCLFIIAIYENKTNWKDSFYFNVREKLNYDNDYKDWEFIIFNGIIKLNYQKNNLVNQVINNLFNNNLSLLNSDKELVLEKLHFVITNTEYKYGRRHEIIRLQSIVSQYSFYSSVNFTFSHSIKNIKPLFNKTLYGGKNTKLYITIDYVKCKKILQLINIDYEKVSFDILRSHIELNDRIKFNKRFKWINYTEECIKHSNIIKYINIDSIHKIMLELSKKNNNNNNNNN